MKKVLLGSVLVTTLFASNGAVFADRTDTSVNQKDETQALDTNLQLPENGGFDGKVPNNKSEQRTPSLGRTSSDRAKAWGFSYVPKGMSTQEEIALLEREQQDFDLNVHAGVQARNGDQNIHIGVKNKTRLKSGWKLQATLTSDFISKVALDEKQDRANPLQGATFKLAGTQAKENKTNEKTELKDGEIKLENLVESELNSQPSGDKEVNTSPTDLLDGSSTVVHNAVYDLAFSGAKLSVPNTRRVPVGNFQTSIKWTLAQVPGAL